MRPRFFNVLVCLLMTMLLVSVSGSVLACGADDPCHQPDANATHHGATHCGCHSTGLPTRTLNPPGNPLAFERFAASEELHLPLVIESISTPPEL